MKPTAYYRAIKTMWHKRAEFRRLQRANRGKGLDELAGLPANCLGEASGENAAARQAELVARIEALREAVVVDRRIWDRTLLSFEEQTYQRQKSLKFFRLQIELIHYLGGCTVVEIGSARAPLRHALTEFNPVCCNDGHSTHHWAAQRQFDVHTVDVSPAGKRALDRAGYPNLTAYTTDGIAFLREWSGAPIDLLYLDAWDVGVPHYAERHLEAFEAAQPHLASRHVIGVDDTDFAEGGKGKLLVPHLKSLGYHCLADGRQSIFTNFSVTS